MGKVHVIFDNSSYVYICVQQVYANVYVCVYIRYMSVGVYKNNSLSIYLRTPKIVLKIVNIRYFIAIFGI